MVTFVDEKPKALLTSIVHRNDFETIAINVDSITINITTELGKYKSCVGLPLKLVNEVGSYVLYTITSAVVVANNSLLVTAKYDSNNHGPMYHSPNTIKSCKWLVVNYHSDKERIGLYTHRDLCGLPKDIYKAGFTVGWYGDWIYSNNKTVRTTKHPYGDIKISKISEVRGGMSSRPLKRAVVIKEYEDYCAVSFASSGLTWSDHVTVLEYKTIIRKKQYPLINEENNNTQQEMVVQ